MAVRDEEVSRIKVPVGEVAVAAYRAVFGRLGLILELGWLPLLTLLAATLGLELSSVYVLPGGEGVADGVRIVDLAAAVIGLICLNAFAVRWHHTMLFADPHAVPRRLFLRAWVRFLAYTLLFYLLAAGLMLGIVASGAMLGAASAGDAGPEMRALAAGTLGVALAFCTVRSALLFPAAASGRPLTWPAAWRLMRGNTWRLVGATFLVLMPIIVTVGAALNRLLAAVHLGGLDG
ncbi:MAG: hypothetical protein ACRDOE_16580, partial [Streptosporangiaceae bacterium]